jgi:hypothetical protein
MRYNLIHWGRPVIQVGVCFEEQGYVRTAAFDHREAVFFIPRAYGPPTVLDRVLVGTAWAARVKCV